jgi:hypothetical protein
LYSHDGAVNAVPRGRSVLGYEAGLIVLETQAGGAADKGAAPFVEAQEAASGASDADALTCAEAKVLRGSEGALVVWRDECAEPEWAGSAEVDTVEAAIDLQCGGKAAGTAREIEEARCFAVELHLLDTSERFEGAEENSAAHLGEFRADVKHEVISIGEVNIGMPAAEKHRAIARGRPAEMMRGRVARRISFGFDNAAAEPGGGEFAHDDFADEEAREGDGVDRQLGAAEAADRNARSGVAHDESRLSLEMPEIKCWALGSEST